METITSIKTNILDGNFHLKNLSYTILYEFSWYTIPFAFALSSHCLKKTLILSNMLIDENQAIPMSMQTQISKFIRWYTKLISWIGSILILSALSLQNVNHSVLILLHVYFNFIFYITIYVMSTCTVCLLLFRRVTVIENFRRSSWNHFGSYLWCVLKSDKKW